MFKDRTNRVDELGRVLIPKFIRLAMDWKEKDLLLLTPKLEEGVVILSLAESNVDAEDDKKDEDVDYTATPQ